ETGDDYSSVCPIAWHKMKGAAWASHSAEAAPERSKRLLGSNFFDILNHISHALQLFSFFIGDFVPKFFFQSHYQLDRVQRVGAQILDKFGIWSHLVGVDAQLFYDDVFYSLLGRFFCSHGLLR